jgi:ribonuclease HII
MDECGRGALAGPLVAAAVKLNVTSAVIEKLSKVKFQDSKKLTPLQREKIYETIKKTENQIAWEVISVEELNEKGIGWANRQIFINLAGKIEADEYIADGNLKLGNARNNTPIKSVVKADDRVPGAIAAGIVAKCERDKLMKNLHKIFPQYGWGTNVGYGTREHIEAIIKFGKTKFHREMFTLTATKNYYRREIPSQKMA